MPEPISGIHNTDMCIMIFCIFAKKYALTTLLMFKFGTALVHLQVEVRGRGNIWNRDIHYRNRVFSTYRFGHSTYRYVLSTDWYRKSILVQTGTYRDRYVLSMYQNNVMYVGHQQGYKSSVQEHHCIHVTHTQYCFQQAYNIKQHGNTGCTRTHPCCWLGLPLS